MDGTVEAIMDLLDTYDNDACRMNILNFGVGEVTEQDIELAAPFNGMFKYKLIPCTYVNLKNLKTDFAIY